MKTTSEGLIFNENYEGKRSLYGLIFNCNNSHHIILNKNISLEKKQEKIKKKSKKVKSNPNE